jgi:hypothetical protein
MDMLTALAEARRLTLSETLRLGLRCLSDQPETAADVVFSADRDAWTRSNS